MAKHTELPWIVDENGLAGYGDNGPNFFICREGESHYGKVIATLNCTVRHLDEGDTPRYLEAKANAELIARAVNVHADLLAALKAIVTPTGFANLTAGGQGTHGVALAAIAKAEG